jgi:SAM-dependent methyltransferase
MSFKVYYFKSPAGVDFSEYWRKGDLREHLALVEIETTLPVVVRHMPVEEAILDAGCGVGRWTHYLRKQGYRAIGLDRSYEGLTIARHHGCSFPGVCADVLRTPFQNEVFGAVISFGLVEHFEEGPLATLAELRRILKPGGYALIIVPYNNVFRKLVVNPLYRLRNLKRRLLGYELAFSEYRFSAREMRDFLRRSRFEVGGCYPDEFVPPKCKGLFIDRRTLQGGLPETVSWEVGRVAQRLRKVLDAVSPWLCSGGVLCVAQRPLVE